MNAFVNVDATIKLMTMFVIAVKLIITKFECVKRNLKNDQTTNE